MPKIGRGDETRRVESIASRSSRLQSSSSCEPSDVCTSSESAASPPTATMRGESSFFCHKFRYFILLVATACLTIIFSCMVTINITLTCMSKPTAYVSGARRRCSQSPAVCYRRSAPRRLQNHSVHVYDSSEKTAIQWTVAIASMLGTFPFSYLCTRFGSKKPFLVSGLVSAAASMALPIAADSSFVAFCAVRVVQVGERLCAGGVARAASCRASSTLVNNDEI